MQFITKAEYARRAGVSRASVTQWANAGRIVLQGDLVNVEESDAMLEKYRRGGLPKIKQDVKQTGPVSLTYREIGERLAALDWQQPQQWDDDSQARRARQAAKCVGLELVESARRDDAHFGGWRLTVPGAGDTPDLEQIAAGFGFELGLFDVLEVCREHLGPMDGDSLDSSIVVRLDLLPALARPFGECDKKPSRR